MDSKKFEIAIRTVPKDKESYMNFCNFYSAQIRPVSCVLSKAKSEIINVNKRLHIQKHHRLGPSLSSSRMKSVDIFNLHQICENQTRYNLILADLLQVVETTCIKLVDKTS